MNWPQAAIPLGSVLTVRYGKASAASDRDEDGPYPVVGSAGEMARTHRPLALNPAIVIGRKGNVGQSHYFDGGCWPTDTTFYVEPGPNIDPRFLLLQLEHLNLKSLDRSTATPSLRREDLEAQPVVLPLVPDQRRIVAILEEHLSDLDDAASSLRHASVRCQALVTRSLSLVRSGDELPLPQVAVIQGGIQKQAKRAPVSNAFPFLRVANVTATGLDLAEVHRVELFNDELARYRLQAGDLLVVEGNGSPTQIGRAALWDDSIPDCVHQNHLIRVRPDRSKILSEYLVAVWNSPENRSVLTDVASSSSGLHTLSVRKLAQLRMPVPSLERQSAAIAQLQQVRESVNRLQASISVAATRGKSLRHAVLAAAFAGRLTGHGSDTDVIERLSEEESA